MEYNTQQPHLTLAEYGRHVHKMVMHCKAIKNRDERNRCANSIITVMGTLNPQLRDVPDFKHKLWDHLFVMADFDLDVDAPYTKPSRETFQSKPDRMKYPSLDIRYKHYGRIVEKLINEGAEMPDGDMKKYFVELLANLMKRHYLNWNRDSVNDEVIVQHLKELSKGKLKLDESFNFKATQDIIIQNKQRPQQGSGFGGKKQFHKRGKFRKKY
ncbi:MAG: DUF4290 domain-containing protein [Bacteroidia bacterium]|nr:DUF4290 domain-containing protein [Bacteroidia bacterium]